MYKRQVEKIDTKRPLNLLKHTVSIRRLSPSLIPDGSSPSPSPTVFILGILRGEYSPSPPKKILFPPNTFVSGKSQLLLQRKAFNFPPEPPTGVLPLDPAEEQPQTPSSGVNPLMSTVAGHLEFLVVWCQNIMYKCAKSISF